MGATSVSPTGTEQQRLANTLHRGVRVHGGWAPEDYLGVVQRAPVWKGGFGGLDIWLTRHLSLGIRAQYRGVDLIDYDAANDDTFVSMLSAAADLTVRF